MTAPTVRQARPDDHEAVAAFTQDTWADQAFEDYVPRIFPEWIETDGDDQRTVVAEIQGEVAGLARGVLLSPYEGWLQGLRVDPAHRGRGVARQLTDHLFAWCRDQGASVARNMVFSWNDAGLGISRTGGFEPGVEGRWARPEPDPDASPGLDVVDDFDAAWSYWQRSEARDRLGGLAVDPGEPWSLSSLTRERLHDLAEGERVLAIRDGTGTRAATARVRTRETETDDGETGAVYGFTAWEDLGACRALFDAIAADAAAIDVDHTRVLTPESCRHVSDAAAVRAHPADEPFFVLERDLTGTDAAGSTDA